ncbi:hypothetical protein GCM10022216_14250 [Sphingobacterium kyonggiense]|uniref:HTH cro/C1-type domain-containing protein n=1 Tax=Sphingobacterium kyonggiense TaxID=714075 RepID=A0ABP7YKX4_9SPHI
MIIEHPISQRIKIIIDRESKGKVVDFASKLSGIPYQVISRLFKQDARSGKYPTPSTDLILEIINKFTYYNPTWLLTGYGEMFDESEVDDEFMEKEYGSSAETNSPEFLAQYWQDQYIEVSKKYMILQEKYSNLLMQKLEYEIPIKQNKK